jgi:hypothetical protein
MRYTFRKAFFLSLLSVAKIADQWLDDAAMVDNQTAVAVWLGLVVVSFRLLLLNHSWAGFLTSRLAGWLAGW